METKADHEFDAEVERALDEAVEFESSRLKVPKDKLRAELERVIRDNANKQDVSRLKPVCDAVLHKVIEQLGRLTILLVNHLFGTNFTGWEKILRESTEIVRHDESGESRTIQPDSGFIIVDATGMKHSFYVECSLRQDGALLFRIAGDAGECAWEYRLPRSAIILLLSGQKNTETWKYRFTGEDGKFIEQTVPVLSLPAISIDDLFEKNLFTLVPFYAFTYGTGLSTLEATAQGQKQLLRDEQAVRDRILSSSELTEEEKVRLQELTTQVIGGLIEDADLREEMQRIMYPRTVALKSDRVLASAEAKGRAEGMIDVLMAQHHDHADIVATLIGLLSCTLEEAERLIEEYSATHERVS